MVICSSGGKVAIISGSTALKEYAAEEKIEDNLTTYTCYVQAIIGEEYEVAIKNLPLIRQGKLSSNLYIDGVHVGEHSYCVAITRRYWEGKTVDMTYKGFSVINSEGQRVVQAFKFAKLPVLKNGDKKMSRKEEEQYCTIRVELNQVLRSGNRKHGRAFPSAHRAVSEVKSVPPGSGPAAIGICTKPGREMPEEHYDNSDACSCTLNGDIPTKRSVFIFHYWPHSKLVKEGLKSEDFHVDIGVEQPKIKAKKAVPLVSASKKRVRDEDSQSEGKARIKQEDGVVQSGKAR